MMMEQKNEIQETTRIDALFEKVSALINQARKQVATTINVAEVYTKYHIGLYIVEYEQQGKARAEYGKQVLKTLSNRLSARFGNGWSEETLKLCRRFFMVYSNSVNSDYPIQKEIGKQRLSNSSAVLTNLNVVNSHCPEFSLSWSNYLILMRIENSDARSFYEIECAQQQWSVRQLSRQVGSSLYERLALSRNKDEVMRLAREGQTIEKPSDIIKNPMTLEFLGLRQEEAYTESKLENAIISKLQSFMLEMGKGFLFEKRQRRFTFDEQNYYIPQVLLKKIKDSYDRKNGYENASNMWNSKRMSKLLAEKGIIPPSSEGDDTHRAQKLPNKGNRRYLIINKMKLQKYVKL